MRIYLIEELIYFFHNVGEIHIEESLIDLIQYIGTQIYPKI